MDDEDDDDDQSHAVVMGRNTLSPIRQTRRQDEDDTEALNISSQGGNRQIIQVTVGSGA